MRAAVRRDTSPSARSFCASPSADLWLESAGGRQEGIAAAAAARRRRRARAARARAAAGAWWEGPRARGAAREAWPSAQREGLAGARASNKSSIEIRGREMSRPCLRVLTSPSAAQGPCRGEKREKQSGRMKLSSSASANAPRSEVPPRRRLAHGSSSGRTRCCPVRRLRSRSRAGATAVTEIKKQLEHNKKVEEEIKAHRQGMQNERTVALPLLAAEHEAAEAALVDALLAAASGARACTGEVQARRHRLPQERDAAVPARWASASSSSKRKSFCVAATAADSGDAKAKLLGELTARPRRWRPQAVGGRVLLRPRRRRGDARRGVGVLAQGPPRVRRCRPRAARRRRRRQPREQLAGGQTGGALVESVTASLHAAARLGQALRRVQGGGE